MQYMRHRVQAPITIGDLLPGLPSDDTHELGEEDPLSSWPSTSIITGGDRFSCSSSLAPPLPLPLPRFMARTQPTLHKQEY
jgi:hypothetical protein